MKMDRSWAVALTCVLAACAQVPKPVATETVPAAAPAAIAAPAPLAAAAAPPAMDAAGIAAAQRNLRALGYGGKSGEMSDTAFQRALLAFEKDQGLAEDGHLTPAIAEKLRLLRAALLKPATGDNNRSAMFLYSDGAARRQAYGLVTPPQGLVANARDNFLLPLRPGAQGSFHLGSRGKDGSFKPVMTVTCQVGRVAQTGFPVGLLDAVTVDCRGDASNAPQWHSLYSPALAIVLRQEGAGGTRDLIAIRPVTADWPAAARTGLDWAITHALEAPLNGPPVEWSSTAVEPHFEIKAAAKLSGTEAGLSGKYATQPCRQFEMVQNGGARFPGIACQNAGGTWFLPGSSVQLAVLANGIAAAAPRGMRSAQN
jgi:hypothetical protein